MIKGKAEDERFRTTIVDPVAIPQKLAAAVPLKENNLMVSVFCGHFFQLTNMEPAFSASVTVRST